MNIGTKLVLVALLALVTLTAGCATAEPVYVDPRFTAEERMEIQKAADMWTAVGAPVDLVWDMGLAGHDRTIVRASHREAVRMETVFMNSRVTGFYNGTGRTVVDMDQLRAQVDSLTVVVAHEMGHMLGLAHVGNGDALMSAVRTDASPIELTRIDLVECHRVGSCPSSTP